MVENYTSTQIEIMILTYMDTSSQDEVIFLYDTFFRELFESDVNWEELEETEKLLTPEQIDNIRLSLYDYLQRDLEADMRFLADVMMWVFGLEYVGTIQNDDGKFVYEFDNGEDGYFGDELI